MGDLHGDPRSLSAPMFVLFWGGGLSPLRCLFFKFAFGAVYTGTSVLSLLRHLFFFGWGVRFFSAFNAVLFCTFVVWRVVGAFGYVFCYVWALGRRFEFAVSWLCECRLSHLGGGVNKKNTLPGGRPANREPAGACVRGAGMPQSGGQ